MTDRQTDKIAPFITRKGLASLAPINYTHTTTGWSYNEPGSKEAGIPVPDDVC